MSTEHLSTISNGSIFINVEIFRSELEWRQKNTPQNSKQTMNNISNENVATETVNISNKFESNESKKCLCQKQKPTKTR